MPVVVVIKRKPKNISRSSFAGWELSRVNSFISFLFFGVERRRPWWKCWVALICIIVDLTKSPYYLVFSLVLNACRFQLSPMHVHYYYYPHRSVVQVKGNNDDIWWTDWDERSWYELDLSCFVNMISSSFLIQPIMNETCLQWQLDIIVAHAMLN